MLRTLRWVFISTALFLLFVEVWVGFPTSLDNAQEENPALNKPLKESLINDKHMEGVHIVESQSGSRDWELFSKSAEGSTTTGEWELYQVRVLFYG